MKQPPSLAKHLKLKSMYFNTKTMINVQLLQHLPVGTNSIRCPQFGTNFQTIFIMHHVMMSDVISVTIKGTLFWTSFKAI